MNLCNIVGKEDGLLSILATKMLCAIYLMYMEDPEEHKEDSMMKPKLKEV